MKKITLEFQRAYEKTIIDSSIENLPLRLQVFIYLCFFPGTNINRLSKVLKCTSTTVRWHIKKLMEKKLIQFYETKTRKYFFPAKFVDVKDYPIFMVLGEPSTRVIVRHIYEHHQSSKKSIIALVNEPVNKLTKILNRLTALHLIEKYNTGREVIYMPNRRLTELIEFYKNRPKSFIEFMRNILTEFGVEIIKSEEYLLHGIYTSENDEKISVEVPITPFNGIL